MDAATSEVTGQTGYLQGIWGKLGSYVYLLCNGVINTHLYMVASRLVSLSFAFLHLLAVLVLFGHTFCLIVDLPFSAQRDGNVSGLTTMSVRQSIYQAAIRLSITRAGNPLASTESFGTGPDHD